MTLRLLIFLIYLNIPALLAEEKLTIGGVSALLTRIDKATEAKDFENATAAYFEGTNFFSKTIINGKEEVVETDFNSIIRETKTSFSKKKTIFDEVMVRQNLVLSEDGNFVDVVSDTKCLYRDEVKAIDFKVRSEVRIGIVEGQMRILQETVTFLSSEPRSHRDAFPKQNPVQQGAAKKPAIQSDSKSEAGDKPLPETIKGSQ
jgi:hypothetical protein